MVTRWQIVLFILVLGGIAVLLISEKGDTSAPKRSIPPSVLRSIGDDEVLGRLVVAPIWPRPPAPLEGGFRRG